MCGIAGIIASLPDLVSEPRVRRMTNALAHRGPDGEGSWKAANGVVAFGHRRLSVIDLSILGAQPMHYKGRYSIVYNGEIYNYREIKSILQQRGFPFVSESDTEVILAAYAAWGPACLEQFDGMFAFAIWDNEEQKLFAARDRFGEKPFYYVADGRQFLFASEMKALWAAGVERQMDESMLFNYLTLGYIQDPGDRGCTFYRNIRKLPAGHYLLCAEAGSEVTEHAYWNIHMEESAPVPDEAEAVKKLRSLLSLSVTRRLRSDVAVGTSLSGGLDSASVITQIKKTGRYETLHAFSAVFPGFIRDESRPIGQLAGQLAIQSHRVQPNATSLIDDFERICYHQEEPFQSASIIAQYRVFQLAKEQEITVLLDGQGADEVLAGYGKYFPWYWRELYLKNRSLLRHEVASADPAIAGQWDWKQQLFAHFPHFAETWLIRQRSRQQKKLADLSAPFVRAFGRSHYDLPHIPSLNGALYYNTFSNGLEELLQYADRNAMAHGREVRLPFLFHELVAFVFSLPAAYKIRDGYSKWLLRKAMEQDLPANIVWNKTKIGFEPPQAEWMKDVRVIDLIQESRRVLVSKGVLKPSVLDKKIQPQDSHAAENFDWRYMVAGSLLR